MNISRLSVRKALRPTLATVAAVAILAGSFSHAQADIVTDAGARAVAWLVAQQQADGGFSNGFTKGSDLSTTADAVVALAAAQQTVAGVKSKAGKSPLDYLATAVQAKGLKVGQYAKIALAVKAAGLNPAKFGGKDLIALIQAGYNDKTGVIGDSVFIHATSVLALASAGAAVPEKALATLESFQTASGGWAFLGSGDPDVDTTATAVQALIAAGRPANSGPAGRGLGYLHSVQNEDGGYPYQTPSPYGTDTNANSTALVAQAVIASGDQPESWAAAKGNPLGAIVTLQQASGSVAYQGTYPSDNAVATIGAIQALYRTSLIVK
jgi:hypothetical protein